MRYPGWKGRITWKKMEWEPYGLACLSTNNHSFPKSGNLNLKWYDSKAVLYKCLYLLAGGGTESKQKQIRDNSISSNPVNWISGRSG